MKKIFYSLFVAAMILFSCEKDNTHQSEETLKLLTRIESESVTVDISYNDNKTVQKIDVSNDIIINFQYSENKISILQVQYDGPNSEANTFLFSYDDNGRIDSMTDYNLEVFDIAFDEAENKYQYNLEENEVVNLWLTDFDEITKFTKDRPEYDDEYEYIYSDMNKGPLGNSNPVALHILLAVPEGLIANILNRLTKKPLDSFRDGLDTVTFENTFDSDGYLILREWDSFIGLQTYDNFEYITF